jgi:hypothetical protein
MVIDKKALVTIVICSLCICIVPLQLATAAADTGDLVTSEMISPTEGQTFTNINRNYTVESNMMDLRFKIGVFLDNNSYNPYNHVDVTASYRFDNQSEQLIREYYANDGNYYYFTYLRTGIPHFGLIDVGHFSNGTHEVQITAHITYGYFTDYSFKNLGNITHTFPPTQFYVYNYPPTPLSQSILSPENMTYHTSSIPLSVLIIAPENYGAEYDVRYSLDNETTQTLVYIDQDGSQNILLNTQLTGIANGAHELTISSYIGTSNVFFTVAPLQPSLEPSPSPSVAEFPAWTVLPIVVATAVGLWVYFSGRRAAVPSHEN